MPEDISYQDPQLVEYVNRVYQDPKLSRVQAEEAVRSLFGVEDILPKGAKDDDAP
jgi:hypothetical protein